MYAVIRSGGKQYRVAENDVIVVEKLAGEPGSVIAVGEVLMLGEPGGASSVGAPRLENAAVFAEVLEQGRGAKILVFKKKRRKNYRRTKGHRQQQTVLRVLAVSPTGEKPATRPKAEKPAPAKPEAEEAAVEAMPAPKAKAPAKAKAKPKTSPKDKGTGKDAAKGRDGAKGKGAGRSKAAPKSQE